ncbi:Zinc finger MYND domain-containing protein 12 [Phytophthora pseudosyringae]|uniref:Zinc finger MYND domain-containing protein 12 n=1 Tax=Phytophthora pseudosyringae TaxID=221518 RepID=A0A8T1VCB1_9STRA|nr:Zinc finger MYND domain-containing protein 12 [Phytophthora pseudosyringae]
MASTSVPRSPQRHGPLPDATEGPSAHEQCEQMRRESEELCFLRQLKPAHAKAVAALKMATETYGKNSLRLVPFYLVLVDISLRERQLKPAEEVLSLVNWLLVKERKVGVDSPASGMLLGAGPSLPELPEEMKNIFVIRMNKLYSLLHLEYGAYADGLQRAAHGAYHCSLLFGPDHLYTSELYFCLGLTFHRMQRAAVRQQPAQQEAQQQQRDLQQRNQQNDSALAMLDKVVDIWYRFLTNPPEDTAAWMLEHQRLRIQEASSMLQQIVSIRQNLLGMKHVATGEALYTLGLLFLFLGDHTQAKAFVKQALDIYVDALGPEHPSTVDVIGVLHQLDEAGV